MKIAIVIDWLVTYAGAEKVLEQMLKVYPNADLFSLIDFIPENQREFILNKQVTTSFIQKLPFAKKKYRSYLSLMPLAIEQLDVSKYDIVISSSHCVAKGIINGPDQLHISYVHSPIRYAWDLQHQYLRESGLNKGIKGLIAKRILHKMRLWDYRTSNGVDYFLSNSDYIGRRIWKVYRRESNTIYPPVSVNDFELQIQKENFYVTASRLVPYKKMDLIVEAFSAMSDKTLYVIGTGPDFNKIKSKAASNVKLLGYQEFSVLKDYMQRAKGFVFAAEEDFGITPVEAQACGTPVIAYGKGGALETVRGLDQERPTGTFFKEQTVDSLKAAVRVFEENYQHINPNNCRDNALTFSEERFRNEFRDYVENKVREKWGTENLMLNH
ncbi:glycosyltransferase family 4 protein [Terrilactibacillus laevilacticus]|uniref:glycosyltransferase family 4 protein n=1 Tax=Terrilactibacillus laevilacticus TaxID=1380157 RepID=UPI00114682C9|nr:glycosyltransferase family 4 protein [Terrilactibacillus laevilacticus]